MTPPTESAAFDDADAVLRHVGYGALADRLRAAKDELRAKVEALTRYVPDCDYDRGTTCQPCLTGDYLDRGDVLRLFAAAPSTPDRDNG